MKIIYSLNTSKRRMGGKEKGETGKRGWREERTGGNTSKGED